MGNNPSSTSKPPTPTTASSHDSPRSSKKEPKNLVSIHNQQIRSPASPEASTIQATGTSIINKNSQSRPLSILNSSSPSTSSNNSSAIPKAPEPKPKPAEFKDEHSKPVAVPFSYSHSEQDSSYAHDSQYEESLISGPTSSSIQDMSYHINRPPRLPLPIEEEIHTPGSPIVGPSDADVKPVDDIPVLDESSSIPRRASGLSNATDEDDAEELRVDKTRPTIPTRIEWSRGGQKVYVTGTPFQWSRKQRLVPAKDREGVLQTIIPVFPGTHHIKFLVDGNMQTSPDLPTTVDFGNNLVNYIEVSGDDAGSRNVPLDAGVPKSNEAALSLPSRQPSHDGSVKGPQPKVIDPVERFSAKIPQYLDDFDQPEESSSYRLSALALDRLPPPPSLPGFLSKPIMNNTTLIKDDNSVLNMPNHTILNHLATCSIKNNVLAVSATTRYQSKYVTTIIYKATKNE
ncbi:carbohydrate-binding module family 48 protein [Annulohypoxylon maeteangense]|uniref:carbohydrate-binding module family 48 protein n=1 Tax=Annulohypoxylon maeteangense TaxID=1927788 RepID=UPI002007B56C|nr:carbohydrate-binding module family 48 protein [Annulohypoxylon maeteangense]KAI0885207.1 carbohydrate-binding module family 48 protein [Annulohypoxylon maeteangense]